MPSYHAIILELWVQGIASRPSATAPRSERKACQASYLSRGAPTAALWSHGGLASGSGGADRVRGAALHTRLHRMLQQPRKRSRARAAAATARTGRGSRARGRECSERKHRGGHSERGLSIQNKRDMGIGIGTRVNRCTLLTGLR